MSTAFTKKAAEAAHRLTRPPMCPRCFIENKPCARHCDPTTCPDPAHDTQEQA